jgi:hypothetical protein
MTIIKTVGSSGQISLGKKSSRGYKLRGTGSPDKTMTSQSDPNGVKLYSFRISRGFRGVAFRDRQWIRLLSLHPDHDSAYH